MRISSYRDRRPTSGAVHSEHKCTFPPRAKRRGATLTEVLMAVMLMGIGVVTLATLFPISILRSIQATQLTNATILRYNAEALLLAFPVFVLDPDFDAIPDTAEHIGEVYVVDPLGWHRVNPPPLDNPTVVIPDPPAPEPNLTVRDWFGNKVGDNGFGVTQLTQFGGLRRYEVFLEAYESDALFTMSQHDSWRFQFDAVPTSFTATSVTLPSSIDLTNLSVAEVDFLEDAIVDNYEDRNSNGILDLAASRVQLFDSSGRGGQSRRITAINTTTNTLYWTEDIWDTGVMVMGTGNTPIPALDIAFGEDINQNAVLDGHELPANFTPERVRVLTQDTRYSWMLTVRNTGGVGNVNVVVFFNRSFETEGEFMHAGPVGPPLRQAFVHRLL